MVFMVVAALCLTTGCYNVNYVNSKPTAEKKNGSHSFFFWGLAGDKKIKVKEHCPNGASKVRVYQSFGDGFLGLLTLGIWAPRSFELTCTQGEG